MQGEFDELFSKLEDYVHNCFFDVEMEKENYPITFTFTADYSGNNYSLEDEDDDDRLISFSLIFGHGIGIEMPKGQEIDEKFLTSLIGKCKKLHYYYLQIYFCNQKKLEGAHK